MSEANPSVSNPSVAKPQPAVVDEDLSAEIARTIARSPIEQVTCRRVTRNHYRCNWWAPLNTTDYDNPAMTGLLVTTNRVAKSWFLRATRTATGLEITNLSK